MRREGAPADGDASSTHHMFWGVNRFPRRRSVHLSQAAMTAFVVAASRAAGLRYRMRETWMMLGCFSGIPGKSSRPRERMLPTESPSTSTMSIRRTPLSANTILSTCRARSSHPPEGRERGGELRQGGLYGQLRGGLLM